MNISTEDWQIRYSGCYVRTVPKARKVSDIVLISSEVHSTGGHVKEALCTVYSEDDEGYGTSSENIFIPLKNLVLEKIETGIINLERSTVVLLPVRPEGSAKYRRLLHSGSLRLRDPLAHIRRHLDLEEPRELTNIFLLRAWAGNVMQTPASALARVESGEYLASAFSSKYQFSISTYTSNVVIMHLDRVIGQVVDGVVVLDDWCKRFKESLESYGLEVVV